MPAPLGIAGNSVGAIETSFSECSEMWVWFSSVVDQEVAKIPASFSPAADDLPLTSPAQNPSAFRGIAKSVPVAVNTQGTPMPEAAKNRASRIVGHNFQNRMAEPARFPVKAIALEIVISPGHADPRHDLSEHGQRPDRRQLARAAARPTCSFWLYAETMPAPTRNPACYSANGPGRPSAWT